MNDIVFRKAVAADYDAAWAAIVYAKHTMKINNRHQWTDAYPSPEIIRNDISSGHAYVLTVDGIIAAYGVVVLDGEPEYANLHDGTWLSDEDYFVIHRMAVAEQFRGKGIAKKFMLSVEELCRENNVRSIKVDTNHDNIEMLRMLPELGYKHCGRIEYKVSGTRMAFEKLV